MIALSKEYSSINNCFPVFSVYFLFVTPLSLCHLVLVDIATQTRIIRASIRTRRLTTDDYLPQSGLICVPGTLPGGHSEPGVPAAPHS